MADRIEFRWHPFPLRSFVGIGIVWAVIDLSALGFLQRYFSGPLAVIVGECWQGIQCAKVMLLLGWLFLGSGYIQQRLWGLVVFAPLIIYALLMSLAWGGFSDVLGSLLCVSLVAIPGSYLVGLPYLLLRANDHRLMQGVAQRQETKRQFTVRQLLVVTLAVAIVLGLLRAAGQVEPHAVMLAALIILLPWVFPLLMCVGVLSLRWSKVTLAAVCVAAFQIALPLYVLEGERAWEPVIGIAAYTLFFAAHVLLLRGLGFRLVELRLVKFADEIKYLEPDSTGILFVERLPERWM